MEKSQVTTGQLIKTRKDTTKMLDFVDKAFHQMAFTVQPGVILTLSFGALMRRNNRLRLVFNDKSNERFSSVTTVSNDKLTGQAVYQSLSLGNVMAFPTC